MANEVKAKKLNLEESTSVEERRPMYESTVAIYRYAGAALHSMIVKRQKISTHHFELKYLNLMKLGGGDVEPVGTLDQGGLVNVSPAMLPFFKLLLTVTISLINEDMLKKHGQEMIKVALEKLFGNQELEIAFTTCLESIVCGASDVHEYDKSTESKIRIEMSKKVFHSRVNEFIEAKKELDLEKKGKVTDASQSLRDSLKTYSSSQTRKLL